MWYRSRFTFQHMVILVQYIELLQVPRYAELTTEVARAHTCCPCTHSTAMENRLGHNEQFLHEYPESLILGWSIAIFIHILGMKEFIFVFQLKNVSLGDIRKYTLKIFRCKGWNKWPLIWTDVVLQYNCDGVTFMVWILRHLIQQIKIMYISTIRLLLQLLIYSFLLAVRIKVVNLIAPYLLQQI